MAMRPARSTTILSVRRDGQVALGGDGQVTLGNVVAKQDALKIRRLGNGRVLAGFAGSAADAFALLERFEKKLSEFPDNTRRAGDVIEPTDGVIGIGSGGAYAAAAAKALLQHSQLPAREIVDAALKITGEICIYTNTNIKVETLV